MADQGIDWGLAKAPLSNTAPQSGLGALVQGYQGAQAQGIQNAQQQNALNVQPQMQQLALQQGAQTIDANKLAHATNAYKLAQDMLQPSMMAMQQGDMAGAKANYDRAFASLKQSGIDPKSVGAPEQFDPNFVKSAFNNVSQQMAMAKQMMDMASSQSMIDYHGSMQQKNAADIGKINYETGGAAPGGSFTGPAGSGFSQVGGAGAPTMGISGGLTPQKQQEVRAAQASKAIDARQALSTQADTARSTLSLAKEAEQIMNENPASTGKSSLLTQFTNPNVERLQSIYDQFTVNKLKSDYAGAGLGALDVAVFNVLKNTTPKVTDYSANQKLNIQNMQAGLKGVILSNDIASKLTNAGMYDENTRTAIGNEIASKLGVKNGSSINLQNFNNADKVTSEVLKKYGIDTGAPNTEEKAPASSGYSLDELMKTGAFPNQQAAQYYMDNSQKQK
jgi:hypothetical protein